MIAFLNIPAVIIMQAFLYEWYKQPMWEIWLTSLTLPFIGNFIGIGLSKLFRQPEPIPRTVAFETGTQNVPLASAVIALGFPSDTLDQVIIFPTMYGVLQLFCGAIPVTIYKIYRYKRPLKVVEFPENELEVNGEGEKVGIQNDSYKADSQNDDSDNSEEKNDISTIATYDSKEGPGNYEFTTPV